MAQEPSEIREEIAETRDELAGTVQQLVEKADVKARVKEKVSENASDLQARASDMTTKVREMGPEKAKASASLVADRAQQRPWILIAAGIGALIVLVMVGRRRRKAG